MGKPRTLKSSMKAFQEAMASLKPVAPICMQQSRTHSFRDLNSNYYTPPSRSSASTTSSSSCTAIPSSSANVSAAQNPGFPRLDSNGPPPAFLIEDDCCAPSTSCCSSSSSSTLPASMEYEIEATPLVPIGVISSTRFFFSPRTTKSIMEDARLDGVIRKIEVLGNPHEEEEDAGDREDSPYLTTSATANKLLSSSSSFCRDSVQLVMSSQDPYRDFRLSMEEMVEAHGLKEWSLLQELLQCYLRLNDRKTHKIIMLAFVDLVMHLISPDNRPSSPSPFISISPSSPYSSPLLQLCSD